MIDTEDLTVLRSIHLRLGKKVDSLFAGEYKSAFRGSGMEFEDVRPYVPGDDVRQLDWNVTARLGVPHVKQFREERELQLMLVADVSASMRFGAEKRDKKKAMAMVLGAIAFSAVRTGDRVGMLTFSHAVESFVPPKKGRGHAWTLMRNIFAHPAEGTGSRFSDALMHLHVHLKRRHTICIVSDFLFPPSMQLGILAQKHNVHAFVIHDPAEQEFPIKGLVDMVDAESGQSRLLDTHVWSSHMNVEQRVHAIRSQGVLCSELSTQADPIAVLLQHFRQ